MSTNQFNSQIPFLENYKLEGNKLNILIYPHPTLLKKAEEVNINSITPELIALAKNMLYTMYHAPGLGLAAPQIGKSIRLIVLDVNYTRDKILTPQQEADQSSKTNIQSKEDGEEHYQDENEDKDDDEDEDMDEDGANYNFDNFNPMVLINPVIVNKIGSVKCNEGCLSLPGIHEDVQRADEIDVEFYNLLGEKKFLHASGLLSICIQHECDHLAGVVLLDHLSLLKRNFHKRKLMKRKR